MLILKVLLLKSVALFIPDSVIAISLRALHVTVQVFCNYTLIYDACNAHETGQGPFEYV